MYHLERLPKDKLHQLEALWSKLNQIHYEDSRYFKERYKQFTFDERIRKFSTINDEDMRIDCVLDGEGCIKGYCISTISQLVGEIDSLFIDDEIRGKGYGKQLMEEAIKWLEDKSCERIIVSVADGHEDVFSFYQDLGFRPKLTTFELVK